MTFKLLKKNKDFKLLSIRKVCVNHTKRFKAIHLSTLQGWQDLDQVKHSKNYKFSRFLRIFHSLIIFICTIFTYSKSFIIAALWCRSYFYSYCIDNLTEWERKWIAYIENTFRGTEPDDEVRSGRPTPCFWSWHHSASCHVEKRD